MKQPETKAILLINGYKRSGKDTLAKMLQKYFQHTNIISFAEPLKQIVANTFNISVDELEYAKNSGRFKSFIKFKRLVFLNDFRSILQRCGTEGIRQVIDDEIFANLLCRQFTEGVNIIPDWRFLTEYQVVSKFAKANGYKVVRLRVDRLTTKSRADNHASESKLDADYIIDNNQTLKHLKREAELFVAYIKSGGFDAVPHKSA